MTGQDNCRRILRIKRGNCIWNREFQKSGYMFYWSYDSKEDLGTVDCDRFKYGNESNTVGGIGPKGMAKIIASQMVEKYAQKQK